MVGIRSYGAYIPRYRILRRTIYEAMGWYNTATAGVAKGERTVANYDEDSVTMAVAAAQDCLEGIERDEIGGLSLSSTTVPYLERLNAGICSAALALRPDIRTADFGSCLRSGTTALLYACDAVKAGSLDSVLVCTSDCRQGKPGSALEHTFGDGAAAILLGKDDVVAELKGTYSLSQDMADYRRTDGDGFIRSWEERWIRDEGYGKILVDAVHGFLQRYGLAIDAFAKVVLACPSSAAVRGIGKRLGLDPSKLQDNLMANVGDTGSAMSVMGLVAALEEAKPGDKILVVSYGNGSDVLYFEATDKIQRMPDRMGVKGHLHQRAELDNYTKYLVYRDLIPVEMGIRGEETPPVRLSVMQREGDTLAALCGSRCKACGTPQYPKQRVCVNPDCGVVDEMEPYPFQDRVGKIKSFTGDNLAFSVSPPALYGLIDFTDGGRLYLDITDSELDQLEVGTPVKMGFRRKYVDKRRGIYAYFWKAIPVNADAGK